MKLKLLVTARHINLHMEINNNLCILLANDTESSAFGALLSQQLTSPYHIVVPAVDQSISHCSARS